MNDPKMYRDHVADYTEVVSQQDLVLIFFSVMCVQMHVCTGCTYTVNVCTRGSLEDSLGTIALLLDKTSH